MRMARSDIMDHLQEQGADESQRERARQELPGLVEISDHEQLLRDLGADVDALTSADIPGPGPDDINPEEEGPVSAPHQAGSGGQT